MTITTEWNDITETGVNIGVHIKKEKLNKLEGIPEGLNNIFIATYDTMEMVSILKALKDCNKLAFSKAMEIFIEEELENE